jgi:hypothetical protein
MGQHLTALEAAFKGAGLRLKATDKPLMELCRTLAAQMDEAGSEPSTRLTAAYLSALKDLRRAVAESTAQTTKPGKLAELRKARLKAV